MLKSLVQSGLKHHERACASASHAVRKKPTLAKRGYPYGLARQEIPLGARVLSVLDAYDAMTSPRPYRDALGEEQAREELLSGAGTQFDPQVVDAFLWVLQGQMSAVDVVNSLHRRHS